MNKFHITFFGDSHVLKFRDEIHVDDSLQCIVIPKVIAVSGGSAAFYTPKKLAPELVAFLRDSKLISENGNWISDRNLNDEHARSMRLRGRPAYPDPLIMSFGESVLRKSLCKSREIDLNHFLVHFLETMKYLKQQLGLRVYCYLFDPPHEDDKLFEEINGEKVPYKERLDAYLTVNNQFRAACAKEGIPTLDTWESTFDKDLNRLRSDYEFDGVHLEPSLTSRVFLTKFLKLHLSSRTAEANWMQYSRIKDTDDSELTIVRLPHIPYESADLLRRNFTKMGPMVDSTPNPFWGGLPPIPQRKFNSHILYGELTDLGLKNFFGIFDRIIRIQIEAIIGSFSIVNVRCVHSLKQIDAAEIGPQAFHYDGHPQGIYRMLIYLSDVDRGGGGFEWKGENSDISPATTETGPTGTAILFNANRIWHRATAPIISERYALDIILISRNRDVKNFFCIQAPGKTWPNDPGRIKIDKEMRYVDASGIREPGEFFIRVSK
jgi:hypothetical protein